MGMGLVTRINEDGWEREETVGEEEETEIELNRLDQKISKLDPKTFVTQDFKIFSVYFLINFNSIILIIIEIKAT